MCTAWLTLFGGGRKNAPWAVGRLPIEIRTKDLWMECRMPNLPADKLMMTEERKINSYTEI